MKCTGNTYGLKCEQSCGKCSGGVQCDYVTGSCPNGCDAGMYGYKCDLGKVIVKFNSTCFFFINVRFLFYFLSNKLGTKSMFMIYYRVDGIADSAFLLWLSIYFLLL